MKKSLLISAGAFSVASIAAKAIGVFYRIPLNNLIGADGMGLYQAAFPLFSALLAVCGGYTTNAVARLTACHPNVRAKDIMRAALTPIFTVSLVTAVLLSMLGKPIAVLQGNADIYYCYLAIAPALLFVGGISAFRGYLQGEGAFLQSGVCLLIEQAAKTAFGLSLALALSARGAAAAALGALIGVSLSEVAALLYLLVIYKRTSAKHKNRTEKTDIKPLRRDMLGFAIPVAVGALVIPVTQFIESGILLNKLSAALYGLYSGTAATLITLPSAVSLSAANTVMPELSANKRGATRAYHAASQATFVISFAAAVAFIFLSKPIMTLLYSHGLSPKDINISAKILKIEGASVLLLAISQMASAVLQSKGRTKVPAVSAAIGAAVKLAVLIPLVSLFGIYGAAVSSLISSVLSTVITLFFARKILKPIVGFNANIAASLFALSASTAVSYLLGLLLSGVTARFYASMACILLYALLFLTVCSRLLMPKSALRYITFHKKKTLIKCRNFSLKAQNPRAKKT